MSDCIFCKIINGEIPTEFVYENEYVVAINDLHPKAKIHVLVIPKVHINSFNELEDEKLMAEILKGVQAVYKKLGIKSHQLHVNTGSEEGQVIFHLHFHLLSNCTHS